jgi:TonB family protein
MRTALILVLACVLQAQDFGDSPGVAVETNGARLMHRSGIAYPPEATLNRIQGVVTAQVRLDARGNVVDASIVSGPDELRKTVLQSVLGWHFTSDAANAVRTVTVTFTIPTGLDGRQVIVRPASPDAPPIEIGALNVMGPDELAARIPVHVGDMLTSELRSSLNKVVQDYDEHFTVNIGTDKATGKASIFITGPYSRPASVPAGALRIGANVQEANIVTKVAPEYPPLAKAARVQGTVKFEIVIGKDGTVQNIQLISGPPLLIQSAMSALRQWVYRPTLLNGQPVEVVTTVDINFTLVQ